MTRQTVISQESIDSFVDGRKWRDMLFWPQLQDLGRAQIRRNESWTYGVYRDALLDEDRTRSTDQAEDPVFGRCILWALR